MEGADCQHSFSTLPIQTSIEKAWVIIMGEQKNLTRLKTPSFFNDRSTHIETVPPFFAQRITARRS
jgi:hypothetical protein